MPDPRYNNARGGPLEDLGDMGMPPFDFAGVTTRMFTVRANMSRLMDFCDLYLNMDIPREIAHFRPAFPYVFIMIINYGRMAMAARNLGWVSQNEVVFNVPVEMYREVEGRLVFQNWASVSPFIFVDDNMSLLTGREVYGWPKVKAWIGSEQSPWTDLPKDHLRVFSLKTNVLPKLYSGQRQIPRTLLEITREHTADFSELPPDLENPYNPMLSIPRAMLSYASLMRDALELFAGARIRGYPPGGGLDTAREMINAGIRRLGVFLPGRMLNAASGLAVGGGDPEAELSFQNLTLKQFRDAQSPDQACYQAIVQSAIRMNRFNRGGLLGDPQQLRGDPSGGFRVAIHRYPGQPIVESLGMIPDGHRTGEAAHIDVFKPLFPCWTDVDLQYGAGTVICHRAHRGSADLARGRAPGARREPGGAPSPGNVEAPLNTTRGAALQGIAGPFRFPDVTCQVYPLLADGARLERFCNRHLNDELANADPGLGLQPFGRYVYLVVTTLGSQVGTMWSESNNIGWWADREVAFYVPVKCFEDGALSSLALLCPYVFANSGRAVATDREVNGRPTMFASIESPPDAWLEASGPVHPRSLLTMKAEILPAVFMGQQSQDRVLLEIGEQGPLAYNDDVGWRHIADTWGDLLVTDLKQKAELRREHPDLLDDGGALALELLGNCEPFNTINLKQFRDADDPRNACYQAVIRTRRRVQRIYDLREIERSIHVRLHKFPTQPIAETLGLEVKYIDSRPGTESVVQWLEPVRPFWMRFSMEEELGEILCWRSHDEHWQIPASRRGRGHVSLAGYFRAPGHAGVGREATEGAGPFTSCRKISRAWLGEQLAAESAALKGALESLADGERNRIRAPLSGTDRAQLGLAAAPGGAEDVFEAQWQRFLHLAEDLWDSLDTRLLRGYVEILRQRMPETLRRKLPCDRLSRPEAAGFVTSVNEPQIIIERMLSREWEHWGNPRSHRHLPAKPELCMSGDSIGGKFLREIYDDFQRRHRLEETEGGWWVPAVAS